MPGKHLFIMCVSVCRLSHLHVEVRGQPAGVSSLYSPCVSQGSNSGLQAQWRAEPCDYMQESRLQWDGSASSEALVNQVKGPRPHCPSVCS